MKILIGKKQTETEAAFSTSGFSFNGSFIELPIQCAKVKMSGIKVDKEEAKELIKMLSAFISEEKY